MTVTCNRNAPYSAVAQRASEGFWPPPGRHAQQRSEPYFQDYLSRFQTRAKTFLERHADAKREADAKDGGAWRGRRGREAAAPGKGAAESLSSGPASRQTRCTDLAGSRRRLALRILSRTDRLGSRDQTRRDLRRHPNTSRRDPTSNT